MDNQLNQEESQTALVGFYGTVLAVVLFLLTACAPPAGTTSNPAVTAAAKDAYSHLNSEEKIAMSEVLTDDGEEKIDFASLNDAWGKFSEAIQLNPGNARAQFWQAALKPVIEHKGILTRIRPLYLKQKDGANRYKVFKKEVFEGLLPAQQKFLVDGAPDIDTDEKFLEWLDRGILSLDALRTFIQQNKEKTFSLRIPSASFFRHIVLLAKTKTNCPSLGFLRGADSCHESPTGMFPFKLNRADFEVLQYGVSYQMAQLSLLYAFKLNPVSLISGQRGRLSTKEYHETLRAGYDGSLMARNHIALAKSVVPDFIVAERYIMDNQDELCPEGSSRYLESNQRRQFLFGTGICVSEGPINHEARNLEILESILNGHPVKIEQAFVQKPVVVDFFKILNQPPANVSAFFPASYDASGDPTSFDDKSFSPYVDGSATDLYRARLLERENCKAAQRWGCR